MPGFLTRLFSRVLPDDDPARSQAPALPRWMEIVGAAAVATVVSLEFGTELSDHPRLETTVIILDLLLVAGFAVWMGVKALGERAHVATFLVRERVNVLLLLLALLAAIVEPRAAAVPVILRLGIDVSRRAIGEALGDRAARLANLRPAQALALSFLGLIGLGTLLLILPAATTDGQGATLTDAVFTASSAVSVTGLIVQDTSTYWSPFGLTVILILIQVGALGIMVLAAAFAVLVGGHLPGRQQEGLSEAGFGDVMDVATLDGLKRLTLSVAGLTLVIELIGAAFLYLLWMVGSLELRADYDSWGTALWWCFFHSVSAFCHAGFSLEPDSLMSWRDHYLLNFWFMALIALGSFGFPVLADMFLRQGPRLRPLPLIWRRWHIQTKVVLISSLVMNLLGMLAYLFFEYDRTLAGLPVPSKVVASLFHAVSTRSAGFNTIDLSQLAAPTLIVFVVWMFIGSAPGSTGGGVRVTTTTVVVMAVRAMLRGRDDVELFGRTLPKSIVYRSISIVLIAGVLCATFLVLVTSTQDLPLDKLIFETISAFGTVGLSMGITADLDTTGRWLITILMYFGRVGPLTLALAVGERAVTKGYRFPEGRMAVG